MMRLAREHLFAGDELELVAGLPGPVYLVDRPESLFFVRVDRGELRAGGDEVVAIRRRDGSVACHATVGE